MRIYGSLEIIGIVVSSSLRLPGSWDARNLIYGGINCHLAHIWGEIFSCVE